ncbi:hypothetical protein D3C73_1496410 [compost metagenome]
MFHDGTWIDKNDYLQAQISTDGGYQWTNIGSVISRYDSNPSWVKHTISLDQFKGASDVRIAFLATAKGGGANIYLDEVSVNMVNR